MDHPLLNLEFVRDDNLRLILERDWAEIGACFEAGSYKAVLVLAGSVIEAILVDHLLASPPVSPNAPSAAQIVKMELGPLILLAHQEQIVSSETRDLTTVLRDFRNLIHPGRELRLKAKIDPDRAAMARSLVRIVVDDLRVAYAKIKGFTASGVIEAIIRDPAKAHLAEYFVEKTNAQEREKLLRAIPSRAEETAVGQPALSALITVHRSAKAAVPSSVLQAEVAKGEAALKEGQRPLLHFLLFYRDELHLMDEKDRAAIVRYFISNIMTPTVVQAAFDAGLDLKFIGRYMNAELIALFGKILRGWHDHHDDRFSIRAIEQVADYMNAADIGPIHDELKAKKAPARLLDAIDQVPF
jgi:hypothetical protein